MWDKQTQNYSHWCLHASKSLQDYTEVLMKKLLLSLKILEL